MNVCCQKCGRHTFLLFVTVGIHCPNFWTMLRKVSLQLCWREITKFFCFFLVWLCNFNKCDPEQAALKQHWSKIWLIPAFHRYYDLILALHLQIFEQAGKTHLHSPTCFDSARASCTAHRWSFTNEAVLFPMKLSRPNIPHIIQRLLDRLPGDKQK